MIEDANYWMQKYEDARNLILAHNQRCRAACDNRARYGSCGYRRMDGSMIYGEKRCSECPVYYLIEFSEHPTASEVSPPYR